MKSLQLFALLLSITASGTSFCQTPQDYAALAEFLPSEKISSLQSAANDRYAEVAYLNRHGYHLSATGVKDVSEYPNVSSLTTLFGDQPAITLAMIQNQQLNLLAYNFALDRERYSYYRVDGTDELLVIPPITLTYKVRLQD